MTVLLNPAMTKIYLGGSAKERVYCCDIPHEDTIQVLNYSYRTLQQIFWGFENLNLFLADIVAHLRHVGSKVETMYKTS